MNVYHFERRETMKLNEITLHEINIETNEGKLLIAALAHITTTTHTNKNPDEVIRELADRAESIFTPPIQGINISKGENTDD